MKEKANSNPKMLSSFLLLFQFTKCNKDCVRTRIFFECDIEDFEKAGLELETIYLPYRNEYYNKVNVEFLKFGERYGKSQESLEKLRKATYKPNGKKNLWLFSIVLE